MHEERDLRVAYAQLEGKLDVTRAEVTALRNDLETKHRQNRSDIHELRNMMQRFLDAVHKLEIKQAVSHAKWAIVSGCVVAILTKLVEVLWKP